MARPGRHGAAHTPSTPPSRLRVAFVGCGNIASHHLKAAQATGRAVISTDVPGCRETIEDGFNGVLVKPYDAAGLAGAIVELVNDPRRLAQMGRNGRQLAERTFDVKAVNRVVLSAIGVIERT